MLHSKSKPNLGTVGYQQIIGKSKFNPISHRKGWSKDKESKFSRQKFHFTFGQILSILAFQTKVPGSNLRQI